MQSYPARLSIDWNSIDLSTYCCQVLFAFYLTEWYCLQAQEDHYHHHLCLTPWIGGQLQCVHSLIWWAMANYHICQHRKMDVSYSYMILCSHIQGSYSVLAVNIFWNWNIWCCSYRLVSLLVLGRTPKGKRMLQLAFVWNRIMELGGWRNRKCQCEMLLFLWGELIAVQYFPDESIPSN